MRYAILSDVHDRRNKLEAVLADANARGAQRIFSLGDVGGEDCLDLLRQAGAMAVFGNYEVSGWRRLAPVYRSWVESWRPQLAEERFLAVHAAPWWPNGLESITDFGDWLRKSGQPWRALFPYLTESPDHIWQAIVELETQGKTILFYGHTHVQSVWCWDPTGHLKQIPAPDFSVLEAHYYLVGVGSVGLPEDGCWSAYAIYDAGKSRIELIRLERSHTGSFL
jgi:predicted phosphodiesterase